MTFKTLAQIKTEITDALDLGGESFIGSGEYLEYINDGIRQCESKIHTLYEDYFLTSATIVLVQGQSDYALPSNIFADKVRGLMYSKGPLIYPIKRIKNLDEFDRIANGVFYGTLGSQADYQYILINDSASAGHKIKFVPAAREADASSVLLWYIREAATLASDSDVCDIPEFYQFIVQYAKVRIMEKDMHPGLELGTQILAKLEQNMIDTLSNRQPDCDELVPLDMSHYWEHS